ERVDLDGRREAPGARLERGERARTVAARRGREGRGAQGSVTGAGRVEPAVAGEAPRAVDEHAHTHALRLRVGERDPPAVPRPDRLRTPDDRAAVGVGRPRTRCRVDRLRADLPHLRQLTCGYNPACALVAELVDAQG